MKSLERSYYEVEEIFFLKREQKDTKMKSKRKIQLDDQFRRSKIKNSEFPNNKGEEEITKGVVF